MKRSAYDLIQDAIEIAKYRDEEKSDYFNGLVIRQMIYALNNQRPDGSHYE